MFSIWCQAAGCTHARAHANRATPERRSPISSSPVIVLIREPADGWSEPGNHGFQNQYHCVAPTRCFPADLLGNLQVQGFLVSGLYRLVQLRN